MRGHCAEQQNQKQGYRCNRQNVAEEHQKVTVFHDAFVAVKRQRLARGQTQWVAEDGFTRF